MPNSYVPLWDLVAEWAEQSGELPALILTNLADHESHGRLRPGAIRLITTGGYGDRGTLAFLVTEARFADDYGRGQAMETLKALVVSKADILEFCRQQSVKPPPAVSDALRRPWFASRPQYQHLAPPAYQATPEEIAAERQASESQQRVAEITSAAAYLDSMQRILATLHGPPDPIFPGSRVCAPDSEQTEIAWDVWVPRWQERRQVAFDYVERLHDAALTERLGKLDREWAALREPVETARAGDAAEVSVDQGGPKRRRGRPKGSGSLEAADEPLVEEMHRQRQADPRLTVTGAARCVADQAAGENTELESKIRRLQERYSAKYPSDGA